MRPTYTFTFILETDELSASEITNPTFYLNGSVTSNSFTKTLNGSTLTYTRTEPASGSFTYTSQGGSYPNGYASRAKPFMFEPYLYPYIVSQSQSGSFTSFSTSTTVDLDNPNNMNSIVISNIQCSPTSVTVTYDELTQKFNCTRTSTSSSSASFTFTYTMTGGLPPKFYTFENGS